MEKDKILLIKYIYENNEKIIKKRKKNKKVNINNYKNTCCYSFCCCSKIRINKQRRLNLKQKFIHNNFHID